MNSQGIVPDLTNIKPFVADYSSRVDTEINDPVIHNTTGGNANGGFARWTLQNKGFLSTDSCILLGLKNNATNDEGFLAPHIGANQLISSVVLKVGAKTISEIREFPYLSAYKCLFSSNSENLEKNQYMDGKIYNNKELYEFEAVKNQHKKANRYTLDNGLPLIKLPALDTENGSDVLLQQITRFSNVKNETIYRLKLNDLIPFFSNEKNFPLVLCDEQINIEVHFNPFPFNVVRTSANTTGDKVKTTRPNEININKVKLLADYIFYDDELMNEYIELHKNKPMNWEYVDYQLSQQVITTNDVVAGDVDTDGLGEIPKNIRNIGGANLMVNKVLMGLENITEYSVKAGQGVEVINNYKARNNVLSLFNKYNGVRTLNTNIKASEFKYNLKYNGEFLFPLDRTNDSLLMNDIQASEGKPFKVNREHYSKQSSKTSLRRWGITNYHSLNYHTVGKLFFNNTILDGRRINSRGIELEFSNTSIDNTAYKGIAALDGANKKYMQNVFLEVRKYARLENGLLDCYFR